MHKGILSVTCLVTSVFFSWVSQGASIQVLSSIKGGAIANGDADDDLNTFYNNAGMTSSLTDAEVTFSALVDVDLLVAILPDDPFSNSEIDAMSNYVQNGGRILFIGEQHGFAANENESINRALNGIGSKMSLGTSSVDSGFNNLSSSQIYPHPLTANVDMINYGNVNSIQGIPAGGELFKAKNSNALWGGFETIGSGSIVLLGDSNMISNIENTTTNDNHQFFLNVVTVAAIPSPAAASIGILGLTGLLARRRRATRAI